MQPRVIQDLLGCRPCVCIRVEEGRDEVDRRARERVIHLARQLVVGPRDLAVELFVRRASVRETAAQDCEEEHA